MTVKQLRTILDNAPGDAPVLMQALRHYREPGAEIIEVYHYAFTGWLADPIDKSDCTKHTAVVIG